MALASGQLARTKDSEDSEDSEDSGWNCERGLKRTRRRWFTFKQLTLLLSAILILSFVLKTYELWAVPRAGADSRTIQWASVGLLEIELSLSLLLLCNIWVRFTWFVTLACFSAFSATSAMHAWAGARTCGCFGEIVVDPRLTLAFDTFVVAALAVVRPDRAEDANHGDRRYWRLFLYFLGVVGSIGVGFASTYPRIPYSADTGLMDESRSYAMIEPDHWVGKACPLLKHIACPASLREGTWVVLLYHHDCEECKRAVLILRSELQKAAGNRQSNGIAAIEIAPYAEPEAEGIADPAVFTHGRLDATKTWFVKTPVAFEMVNGIVRRVFNPLAEGLRN